MFRLFIAAILAVTVASCCRPVVVDNTEYGSINVPNFVDDDTIVPPPPSDSFIDGHPEPISVYDPIPVYPRLAGAKGIESSVTLQVFVDRHGFVRRANAVKCTHPGYGFEEAAIAAAYGSKWKSAMDNNGNPIGTWVEYKVGFELKK